MPANRFGAVNTQPIYNVTGRNPRDMEQGPTAQPFQAPAAGVAKDFSADQRQQPQRGFMGQMLGDAWWNPLNPLNSVMRGEGGRRGGRPGGGGGGGGDGEGGGGQPITINFAGQSGHRAYENAGAIQGNTFQGDIEGGVAAGSPFSTNNQTLTSSPGGTPGATSAKTPRARKPATAEQKAKRNEQARARRAAAKQSGTTPKPRTPRTPKGKTPAQSPAQSPATKNTTNMSFPVTQSGDVLNEQKVNFP